MNLNFWDIRDEGLRPAAPRHAQPLLRAGLAASFALALSLAAPATALAEHLTGAVGWLVTYTAGGTMEDNYSTQEYIDEVRGLQPGDDITFTVKLSHQNDGSADWYMANDVIESLEDADDDASDSSYEYTLTYDGPTTSRTIYDSKAVGGDDTGGLREADGSLVEYFYLDNLSKGQSGSVTLKVKLDGETEQNAYFDTLGKLKVRFAVEPDSNKPNEPTNPDNPTPTPSNPVNPSNPIVKTGDDTHLFPFYVAMVVSGVVFLVLAVMGVRMRRQEDAPQGAGPQRKGGTR